jgi:starch phosphorylase
VIPALPAAIEGLREVALNLRWAWNRDSIALFRRLDADLWETTRHNPILLLGQINQDLLEAAAADDGFRAHLARVRRDLREYMTGDVTWFRRSAEPGDQPLVAYFSAEFGVTECLSIFAGGLGILAGDHLKSSSDLGLPLVGVGLLYQQGYFHQYLNEAGWQQERYVDNDFHNLPISLMRNDDGTPMIVDVEFPGRTVHSYIWKAQVGRVPLYLLDTNITENGADDRDITDQLYGGDIENRIKQELVLGIGGYRALKLLGLRPATYHMNEGHSAFLALERVKRIMEETGATFHEAATVASAGLIFTTHTPVPAGHDYFPRDLIDHYFRPYIEGLGLSIHEFMGMGRQDPNNEHELFCMTILALKLSSYSNGVSELHGQVSREMWHDLWPGVPEDEVPIGSVTNGVHLRTWISQDMDQLYDRYLGPRWREEPADRSVWRRVERVPPEEIWQAHERSRERLVSFVRARASDQLVRRGAARSEIQSAREALHSDALTIGFSRRFATYKRATLILRDPDRLARILDNPDRPVQIVFSGKAHPRDEQGKELIRQIVNLAREEPFRRRIVFLEDYDMTVAAHLVQGADIWLNNPRRPMEASGTSGMKAAANGVLNVSTLDGWWAEAWETFDPLGAPFGWAIGHGEHYPNADQQDQVEAEDLYGLLERDIVPTFYNRGPDGLPREWIERMKSSIGTLSCFFNTHRMVWEYVEKFYLPAAARYRHLSADDSTRGKALSCWMDRVRKDWNQVSVVGVDGETVAELTLGSDMMVRACIHTGELSDGDLAVQLYMGPVNADGQIDRAEVLPMRPVGKDENGNDLFEVDARPTGGSGLHGFTVRVLPHNSDLVTPFVPGLIAWA